MSIRLIAASAVFVVASAVAFGADNVALGKTVWAEGTLGVLRPGSGFSSGPVAPLSTLTDGTFLAEGTHWQDGTVWWDLQTTEPKNNYIHVELGSTFKLSSLTVQADNNESYQIWIYNAGWTHYGAVPAVNGAGMRTRTFDLPTGVLGSALAIGSFDGDNYYSLSEIQAFGEPVPEPASMLVLGSATLLALKRRRK